MSEEDKPKAKAAIMALAERNGNLTPEMVVEEARPKKSPLHPYFLWDNTEAAERYRIIQAGCLIRRIKVTYEAVDERTVTVRQFVNVQPDRGAEDEDPDSGGKGIYVTFAEAHRVDTYHDQVMRQCKTDVEAFRRKYSAFKAAEEIIRAMDGFTAKTSLD